MNGRGLVKPIDGEGMATCALRCADKRLGIREPSQDRLGHGVSLVTGRRGHLGRFIGMAPIDAAFTVNTPFHPTGFALDHDLGIDAFRVLWVP